MKKNFVRIISVIMSVVLMLSSLCILASADSADTNSGKAITVDAESVNKNGLYPYLTNSNIDPTKTSNSVVIPGVFQSKTHLYNADGTIALNSDGEEYSAPFYLDSTNDIVKKALKSCLFPLLLTLFTQHDFGDMLSDNLSETICSVLGEKIQADSTGKLVYNVKADKYNDNVATLSQEDADNVLNTIPLNDYANLVGKDHLYFFSYCSFGNIDELVDELYALIVKAANASPTGKANIIPISQGGSLANGLLARHPDVGKYLDRIVYIVPALDGTVILGDIYAKGIIDDDDALYNEMFPILLNSDDQPYMGSLVNVLIRLLPNEVLNEILDKTVDCLIDKYIKYNTCMWALVNSGNYLTAADKYLNDPEDAYIRSQTDAFYQAQLNSDANILYQMNTYGVEVFDVCDYNYALYPIVDSWKTVNADGIINLSSTSMGATSVAVNTQLPADYTPSKGEKYIDKYRLVDAGTGLLPDNTFYFHNQGHEKTARNDVIMKLATCLITDKSFTSVNSYPEKFPQFNEARDSKGIIKDLPSIKAMDTSSLSAEDKAGFDAAVTALEAQINNTVVDNDAFEKAKSNVYAYVDKINGKTEEPTVKDKISEGATESFTKFIVKFSDFLYKVLGGKGYSDVFRIF